MEYQKLIMLIQRK